MEIVEFLGTCSNKEIGEFALRYGRKSSYNRAKSMVKKFSLELYNELSMDFRNPWADHTNIKKVKGIKYLHVVYSCIDYIFIIK